ncbi:MAG: ATP-grasp domain-containing protein, partial [Candidatus Dadabacteria bacterium]|nr:ATP-grasp domain-containing protein [Candidatus Dadabacteria bacterium]NIT14159.1 ATP-grasp domain-containing protein [Candidatus Dadabacteria bacterium]
LRIIQDKGKQKNFFTDNKLNTAGYKIYDDKNSILGDIENNDIKLPFVQKACRFGYDGRGVVLI